MSLSRKTKLILGYAITALFLFSVILYYCLYEQRKYENTAVLKIEHLGGRVSYGPLLQIIPDNIWKYDYLMLSRVTKVDLGGTDITNSDLSFVLKLQGIQHLDIQKTDVDDDGLMLLVNMPNLRSLILTNTMTTEDGLVRFVRIRPDITTLPEMHIKD